MQPHYPGAVTNPSHDSQLSRRANARRLHPAEVVHRRRVGVFTCPDQATHVEGAQPMSDEDRAELDGRRVCETLRGSGPAEVLGVGPVEDYDAEP